MIINIDNHKQTNRKVYKQTNIILFMSKNNLDKVGASDNAPKTLIGQLQKEYEFSLSAVAACPEKVDYYKGRANAFFIAIQFVKNVIGV